MVVEEGCKRAWAEQAGNAHGQTGEFIILKPISDAETQLDSSKKGISNLPLPPVPAALFPEIELPTLHLLGHLIKVP